MEEHEASKAECSSHDPEKFCPGEKNNPHITFDGLYVSMVISKHGNF
jgi:hypothetical protein